MSQTRADNDYRTDRAPEKKPGENVLRGTPRWTARGWRSRISKRHFLKGTRPSPWDSTSIGSGGSIWRSLSNVKLGPK